MADRVAVRVILDSPKQHIVRLVCVSDGTGETDVVKVDKSALTAAGGAEPASLEIESVRWNIQGFSSVIIEWDHTSDDLAYALSGAGYDEPGTGFGSTGIGRPLFM